jgi:hypothetical protein
MRFLGALKPMKQADKAKPIKLPMRFLKAACR